MFKKIFVMTLILIVAGAAAFSVYNTVLADKAQAGNGGTTAGVIAGTTTGGTTAAGVDAIVAEDPGSNQGYDQQAVQSAQGGWSAQQADGQAAGDYGQGGRGGSGGSGGQGGQGGAQGGGQVLPVAGELSDAEAQDLLFMREEEKLARDVYAALYTQWGLPQFQSISQSEQMHMDSLMTLLDRYGLADPAQAQAGVFTNPDLQALYNDLIARGSQSLSEALKVGGLIEEVDILDLQSRLAQTDNADIQQVYNNLLSGSINHLRGFSNTLLTQTGETYQPQQMTLEAYQALLSSAQGGGNGQGGNGRGGNGGGGKGRGSQTTTP